MQSLLIVVPFNKLLDVGAQVIEVVVLVGVDFLPFQSFQKAVAARIGLSIQMHRITTLSIDVSE